MILPKREKMSSRSSSFVTGLSCATKSTFSGGFMSASGRSPSCASRRGIECISCVAAGHTDAPVGAGARAGAREDHFEDDGFRVGFLRVDTLVNGLGALAGCCVADVLVVLESIALHEWSSGMRTVWLPDFLASEREQPVAEQTSMAPRASRSGTGERSGMTRPSGSGNGSASTIVCKILQ